MGNREGSGGGAGQTKCRSNQVGKRNGCENAAAAAARHEAQRARIDRCANELAAHRGVRRVRGAVGAGSAASFITVGLGASEQAGRLSFLAVLSCRRSHGSG